MYLHNMLHKFILIEYSYRREYDDVITTTICSVEWIKSKFYIQYVVCGEKPRLFSGEYHVRITKKEKCIYSGEQFFGYNILHKSHPFIILISS